MQQPDVVIVVRRRRQDERRQAVHRRRHGRVAAAVVAHTGVDDQKAAAGLKLRQGQDQRGRVVVAHLNLKKNKIVKEILVTSSYIFLVHLKVISFSRHFYTPTFYLQF